MVLVLAVASGCANAPPIRTGAGPTAFFSGRVGQGDLADLRRKRVLALPKRSELWLRPQWFSGVLHAPGSAGDQPLYVVAGLRVVHRDGAEAWHSFSGNPGAARVDPDDSGRYSLRLRSSTVGPLNPTDHERIELYVVRVPSPGMTLAEAVRDLGDAQPRSEMVLSAGLDLQGTAGAAERRQVRWLLAVEAEPPGDTPLRLERVARMAPLRFLGGHPVADQRGDRIPHTGGILLEWVVAPVGAGDRVRPSPDPAPGPRLRRVPPWLNWKVLRLADGAAKGPDSQPTATPLSRHDDLLHTAAPSRCSRPRHGLRHRD